MLDLTPRRIHLTFALDMFTAMCLSIKIYNAFFFKLYIYVLTTVRLIQVLLIYVHFICSSVRFCVCFMNFFTVKNTGKDKLSNNNSL